MTHRESFRWNEAEALLDGLAARGYPPPEALRYDAARGIFVDPSELLQLRPPAVLPEPSPGLDGEAWLEALPAQLGAQLLVLLRAGAFAVGLWDGGELLQHKCQKRYVTRGQGRAQPTHLATRGKSRYGSRLRLQNAARLLDELRQRLGDWITEHRERRGCDPELLLLGATVRMRARLLAAPIAGRGALPIRPLGEDFAEPSFEELGRQYRLCCSGNLSIRA